MSEEKKEEAKEEVKAEKKPEAKAEAKAEEVKAKPQAAAEGESAKKSKKLAHLTLKEVEQKINEVKEKMGGFTSRYAKDLLIRQKALKK
jgi:hypothetical protein